MAGTRLGKWSGLRTLIEAGGCAGASDGELLRRFVEGQGEAAGSAFAALMARHGPMVLRACRAALGDRHDAEDSFQATFLVLALKARGLAARESVGPWLYGVARHVALRARAGAERRRRHEEIRAASADRVVEAPEEASREVAAIVHEEIGRLPEWCRGPVVLCHLEGRTCAEAARSLGLPPGTVKSRLARARERLRARLALRGVVPAIATAALATTSALKAAVPSRLAEVTVRSALDLSRGVPPSLACRPLLLARETRRASTMVRSLFLAGVAGAALVGLGLPGHAPRTTASAAPPRQAARGLVAPRSLSVAAGQGEAVLFAANDRGERIVDGAKPGRPGRPQDLAYKEETRPLRWAVAVGTVDFRAIRRAMPAPPPGARPDWPCKRIDLERQSRGADGGWSDWESVDADTNLRILDSMTQAEAERIRSDAAPRSARRPAPVPRQGDVAGCRRRIARRRGVAGRPGPVHPHRPARPEAARRGGRRGAGPVDRLHRQAGLDVSLPRPRRRDRPRPARGRDQRPLERADRRGHGPEVGPAPAGRVQALPPSRAADTRPAPAGPTPKPPIPDRFPRRGRGTKIDVALSERAARSVAGKKGAADGAGVGRLDGGWSHSGRRTTSARPSPGSRRRGGRTASGRRGGSRPWARPHRRRSARRPSRTTSSSGPGPRPCSTPSRAAPSDGRPPWRSTSATSPWPT